VSADGYATHVVTLSTSPENVEISLDRGVFVHGKVTGRGGRDPVANAQITAYLPAGTQETKTDRDGAFRLRDIAHGAIRIRVDHPEYVAVERTFAVQKPNDADRPQQLDTVDLKSAGMVQGEVVDDRGNPVAGARVSKDEVPSFLPIGPLPPGVVATDETGVFALGGLAEGEVTLEAFAPGVGRGKESKISVRAERTTSRVRIRLTPDGATPAPAIVAGVAVTLTAPTLGSGALVSGVSQGSEADRAGIRVGDLIVRIDGTTPESERDAAQRLQGPDRQEVVLGIQRGQAMIELRVPRERVR